MNPNRASRFLDGVTASPAVATHQIVTCRFAKPGTTYRHSLIVSVPVPATLGQIETAAWARLERQGLVASEWAMDLAGLSWKS